MSKATSGSFRTIKSPGEKQSRFSGHPTPSSARGSGQSRTNQATGGKGSGQRGVNIPRGSGKHTPRSQPTD